MISDSEFVSSFCRRFGRRMRVHKNSSGFCNCASGLTKHTFSCKSSLTPSWLQQTPTASRCRGQPATGSKCFPCKSATPRHPFPGTSHWPCREATCTYRGETELRLDTRRRGTLLTFPGKLPAGWWCHATSHHCWQVPWADSFHG